MSESYRELMEILGDELRLFREFRQLLLDQHEPIRAFQAERLEKLAERKSFLQRKLNGLETRRQAAVTQIAGELGIPSEKATLRELARHAEPETRTMLLRAREVFDRFNSDFKSMIEDNSRRIDRSMWLVESLRQTITGTVGPDATYETLGRRQARMRVAAKGK